MRQRLAAVLRCAVLVVATQALARNSGYTEMSSGEVRINGTFARYAVVSVPGAPADFYRTLAGEGWKLAPTPVQFPGLKGAMTVRMLEREGHVLYTAMPDPAEDWSVLAECSGRPAWFGGNGDVPGREPLGLPRFAGARRILHLVGRGFEAACYQSSARPRAVLAEASARLASAGWTVSAVSTASLSAARDGAPPLALFAEPRGTGSMWLLLAGTPSR